MSNYSIADKRGTSTQQTFSNNFNLSSSNLIQLKTLVVNSAAIKK